MSETWENISKKLQDGKDYVYLMNKIDEKDANTMSKLCDMILKFEDENIVLEKIQDFVSISVPITKVIDTLFLLLQKYPTNEKIQAQCICCIADCNIYQNATYEKTNYKEGVKLIFHSYNYVRKHFDDYDKGMFYRYCLQALRLFAVDHDIFSDEITDIYNMCKETKVNDEDIINIEHVYTQLKFRSCYNPNQLFQFLWINNETEWTHDQLSDICKFPFVGVFPNILMYMLIQQLNRQEMYLIHLEYQETGVKRDHSHIHDVKPCNKPYKLDDGTIVMSKVMGDIFEEFAPDHVMKIVKKNRELSDNKCENRDEYQNIPFEYAQTNYYINLGLGHPIMMYHLIMKFYKIMDKIDEIKFDNT